MLSFLQPLTQFTFERRLLSMPNIVGDAELKLLLNYYSHNSTSSALKRDETVRDQSYIVGLRNCFVRQMLMRELVGRQVQYISEKCLALFSEDYELTLISNANGEFCGSYPIDLIILEGPKHGRGKRYNDASEIKKRMLKGRLARVNCRFPVPVILTPHGLNICRSATIAHKIETTYHAVKAKGKDIVKSVLHSHGESEVVDSPPNGNESNPSKHTNSIEYHRNRDIQLLRALRVKMICDLMVEEKKMKFGLKVCSSEKVDAKGRYDEAGILLSSLPYPGIEFFRNFRSFHASVDSMHFDWSSAPLLAPLYIPPSLSTVPLQQGGTSLIDWSAWQSWSVLELTGRYLKFLLHFVDMHESCASSSYFEASVAGEDTSGVLVHCISGWDRTPLYISLLRLSLWADGLIHTSLSPDEILYLTLSYDWLLFSHQLGDRAQRGEEILFFCFFFLSELEKDTYSLRGTLHNLQRGAAAKGKEGNLGEEGGDNSNSQYPPHLSVRSESASSLGSDPSECGIEEEDKESEGMQVDRKATKSIRRLVATSSDLSCSSSGQSSAAVTPPQARRPSPVMDGDGLDSEEEALMDTFFESDAEEAFDVEDVEDDQRLHDRGMEPTSGGLPSTVADSPPEYYGSWQKIDNFMESHVEARRAEALGTRAGKLWAVRRRFTDVYPTYVRTGESSWYSYLFGAPV